MRHAVMLASATLAAVCILLAFLSESAPLETLLPVSSIALVAAFAASVFTLSFALLGLTVGWVERES